MSKGIVLSVDDDESIQFVLKDYLESDGYTFATAGSGDELNRQLESVEPTVILLDLKLPDTDGLSLISTVRQICSCPIIVISGESDTTEKVVCLEMGADDYLTKPVELRELSARIKAVLRRTTAPKTAPSTATSKPDKIPFGAFFLDCNQLQLFDGSGRSMGVTTGEYQLLEALAQAPNRVLSRDYLYSITRETDYESYDRAIDIQIGRIRKKMGDPGKELIKTVRGVGYMFVSPDS